MVQYCAALPRGTISSALSCIRANQSSNLPARQPASLRGRSGSLCLCVLTRRQVGVGGRKSALIFVNVCVPRTFNNSMELLNVQKSIVDAFWVVGIIMPGLL